MYHQAAKRMSVGQIQKSSFAIVMFVAQATDVTLT
jgi:hypothetical protein